MTTPPPKQALKFLRWFCREDYIEEIEGDLTEVFQNTHQQYPRKARVAFIFNVIRYFRPEFIKSWNATQPSNSITMFRNYFKVGWRNIARHKMYSAINIGGFAMGLAACFFISLFIRHELTYDAHYPDQDRIYRLIGVFKLKEGTTRNTYFQAPLASVLKSDFPEIESAGRLLASELFSTQSKVRRADHAENILEESVIHADQELLEILNPHFVHGNVSQALSEPNTVAISKSKAEKYFPEENPLGKTLILNDNEANPYKIGGVFEDFPVTSHIRYDFLVTMTGHELWPGEQTQWRSQIYHTYLKVQPGIEKEKLASKLTEGIVKTYMLSSWQESGIVNAKELANSVSLELQPISDIHLRSQGIHDGLDHGDIRFVWLFGGIAAFILIIACVNFINLSTARSANRAKEVGLRKVVGSYRGNLIMQFLSESILLSLLSFMLAIALTFFLLPYFNELSGKSLVFPWSEWWLFLVVAFGAVTIGVLAGLYPAIYLSGFMPAHVLKGGLSRGSGSSGMRSALVVFQFSASSILIIGTFVIYQQLDFILNKDVGFEKEQVLLVQGTNTLGDQLPVFKNELLALADVAHVSISGFLPVTETVRSGASFWKKGRSEEDSPVGGQLWFVDHDYVKTLGMTIAKGRDFNIEMASDSQAVVINQSMAKALGLNDPIGHEITFSRWGDAAWRIIGVVEDFHFESLTEDIAPLCLAIGDNPSITAVRINTTNMAQAIAAVESVWNKFSPKETFVYSFLDESFARMYANVRRTGRIFTSFAALAIMIACLGLFALSSFMLEQRSKEISVRIVLGASVKSIFQLLVTNFLRLVLIALVIAVPVAWFLMQKWLEDYAYRINIGWDVFVMTGICALMIALFTIGYQSLRAALMNPVDNLRSE